MVEGTGATLDTGQRSHPGAGLGPPYFHLAITLPLPVCRRRSSAGRSRPRLPTLCSLQPELLCWSLCQSSSSCRQYVPGVTDGETVTGLKEWRLGLRRQTASTGSSSQSQVTMTSGRVSRCQDSADHGSESVRCCSHCSAPPPPRPAPGCRDTQ